MLCGSQSAVGRVEIESIPVDCVSHREHIGVSKRDGRFPPFSLSPANRTSPYSSNNIQRKTWAFSRVRSDGKRLAFHEVTHPDQLREGEFGFLEPDPEKCPEQTAPDLVLVPGVGFDPTIGARLGRGKGHYDRFLEPHQGNVAALGICFRVQITQLVPELHDVPMNAVVCEDGVLGL